MRQKPAEATALIRVLNSKTKQELEEFEIADMAETILEVRRVFTKRNLMLKLENKCHNLEANIHKLHRKFNVLNQKGLPGLKGIGDNWVKLDDYQHMLYSLARDKSKFFTITGTITGKKFMEGLKFDLLIKHEIKSLFVIKPTFQKYFEVDETYKRLIKFSTPDEDRWDQICQLLE